MRKVLIADDEPSIVLSLEFLFRKQGFTVLIARNGAEARAILEEHQPELIILDIMMPDEDGYSLCRYIRSLPAQQLAKVAFLSAKSKESDIRKGLETGADAYFTKPFSTRTLLVKMLELLDQPPQ